MAPQYRSIKLQYGEPLVEVGSRCGVEVVDGCGEDIDREGLGKFWVLGSTFLRCGSSGPPSRPPSLSKIGSGY